MSNAKAKLTPSGRLLLVERVIVDGWTPAHAARMSGVSRQTLYKWLRRYECEGLSGLEDRSSRPRRCPRRTPLVVEAEILELRQSLRKGPHQLAGRLGLSASTVHAVLARYGLSRLSRLDRSTGAIIRYERERPGELLHVDVKKLGRIPDGGGWRAHGRGDGTKRGYGRAGFDFLHVAVDDHSRFAFVEVHRDEKGETCAGFLTRAIDHFGSLGVEVEGVMTDNAKNYVDSRLFQAALGERRHVRIRPYRPQTNGKAERFNRTLADDWAYKRVYLTNQERLDELEAFLLDYNYVRSHSAIGNKPPASRIPSTT